MPDVPVVSVIAVNYNNAAYVVETLNSIAAQTYPCTELIVVDDGSDDDSPALIAEWLKTCKLPTTFVKHDHNKGVCAAVNSGLKKATGKYVSFVGTDDALMPDKLAVQVDLLEAADRKVAAVYSDAWLMDVNGKPIDGGFIERHRRFAEAPSGNIYAALLDGNFLPAMSLLTRRSVFDEVGFFDEELAYEDYDMWLRIARDHNIIFSGHKSVKYRIRPGSLTFTIKNWGYSDAKIFLKHLDAPVPEGRLRDIVYAAYREGDDKTMSLAKELAEGTSDRLLTAMWLLWSYKIPFDIGSRILGNIKTHIEAGLSPLVNNVREPARTIFFNELSYSISPELFKEIAHDAYLSGNDKALELAAEQAGRVKSRYLKTACLLRMFHISYGIGKEILGRVNDDSILLDGDSGDDVNIFLNNILPLMPQRSVEEIALDAFLQGNETTLRLLDQLGCKTNNTYLRAAYWLWKADMYPDISQLILEDIVKRENAGEGANEAVYLQDEAGSFIPFHLLRMYVDRALAECVDKRTRAVFEMANRTRSRYLMAAYWMNKLGTDGVTTRAVLDHLAGEERGGHLMQIKNATSGDAAVFLREIVPAMPHGMFDKILYRAYANDDIALMTSVCSLALHTKDRYLGTLYLLWHFRVLPETGKQVLVRIAEAIAAGASSEMMIAYAGDGPAAPCFYDEVIALLPSDLQKRIAAEAYFCNDRRMRSVVKYMSDQTKLKYFRALLLLWNFRVNDHTGKIILARIEQYCSEQKNGLYIDLCVYKDIYGAYRSGNISFAGR